MNKKLLTRILIDVCMTICLLFLMAYSLVGEVAHEVIGIVIFVLFVIHHILNRRWLASITKGEYSPLRIIQTVLVFVILILMLGSMVSGIILSNNIFKFIKIMGITMKARSIHMLCAYWGFIMMSVHLGIHWNMIVNMTGRLFGSPSAIRGWIARILALAAAIYGVYAFNKRQIGEYLLMKIHFVFYDFTENVMFFILDYVAVMALVVFITYYLIKLLTRRVKLKLQNKS